MSQEQTLEPCPFCGGQPELEDCRTIWVVRCKCEACVLGKRAPEPDGSETDEYWQGIRQTSIDAWNRRAALSATQPAQAKQSDWSTQRFNAPVYPPDGTESPFTVINLGSGKVQMGDSIHDGRLPAIWFGINGQGMGHEETMNREAHPGETLAVVTFANVEGLDVLLDVIQRIRREKFPEAQAAQSEPAEHWHRLYLEKCQQYNDRVAQLGGVIEGLEAEAAQGEPVPSDQSRWCAYVGGMVAHWVKSAPDAHARLGDDKFEAAIAGIIERRLWALRRDQAPAQPAAGADVVPAQPAPVVPGKPFTGAQRMRLWQNTEKGKSAVSLAAFERIVQTVEAAHRITAAPTPPAQAAVAARDASLAAIHCRLTRGGHIDSHTISTIVAECERALPALATHQQRQDGATVQKGKK